MAKENGSSGEPRRRPLQRVPQLAIDFAHSREIVTPNKVAIQFDPTASTPRHGIAMIYDLEGFSQFFNQPDVQEYVPKFLNHISAALDVSFAGGDAFWVDPLDNPAPPLSVLPSHEKFMGDGCLYVWKPEEGKSFNPDFVSSLCNRLWNIRLRFERILRSCADDVPVAELPQRIRFGLARGTIYELTRADGGAHEFIGFCINLASRLQRYCPALGFIASARLGLAETTLKEHGYIKVIATKLHGFPKEVVIVDKREFERLDSGVKDHLFAPL